MRWISHTSKSATFWLIVTCVVSPLFGEGKAATPNKEKMHRDLKPVPTKTFDLRVVPIFKSFEKENRKNQSIIRNARDGTFAFAAPEEQTEGVKYPKFKSKEPLFGTLKLGNNYLEPGSAMPIAIAVDESGGTGSGYDLFYVDRNGNKDLTDDEPLEEQTFDAEEEKKNYLSYVGKKSKAVICQPIRLSPPGVDLPDDYQVYPIVIVGSYTQGGAKEGEKKRFVSFRFRYPTMRIGKIKIGRYGYRVAVTTDGLLPDFRQCTCIKYLPIKKGTPRISWWGNDCLNAVHQVDGHHYTMAISADGKKLTIAPYEGKFGLLRVGLGKRSLKKSKSKDLLIRGGLHGMPHCAVIGNYDAKKHKHTGVKEMRLPVGDYAPAYVHVQFGDIRLRISENYHSDGKCRNCPPLIFSIKIREDKPYIFDLANTPTVLFVEPAKQTTVARDEVITVKPVLIDPELGIMFRGMTDTSEKITRTFKNGKKEITRTENKKLEPTVEIRNSKGKVVSSGTAEYG